jgi:hypothetical protein
MATDPSKGSPRFEELAKKDTSLVGEILGFLRQNKKWWLLPVVVVIFAIGALVLLSSTVAAPFIYTLF